MCPCPICATIAILLLPFAGYKWAKKMMKKHHCSCDKCQAADHVDKHSSCGSKNCTCKKGK